MSLNVLYAKKEKIYPAYVSKHNSNREKQVIFLMSSNGEKSERLKTLATQAKSKGHKAKSDGQRLWHYLTIKKLSALLRGKTSKHYGSFYCLNCRHSIRIKNKLESSKKVCENKDFCNVIMPSEDIKILESNQYQKPDKAPFIIFADHGCVIEKNDEFKNNPENSSITKVSEHILLGFSMSPISSLRSIKNKHDVFRGNNCMKKFCESLREHVTKIINFKKKIMKSLIKEWQELYENAKIPYICTKN